MDLTGKKIILTGGSGLLGSKLAADLSSVGCDLKSLSNSNFLDNGSSALKIDIRDRQAIINLITETRPDVVFHPAALTNLDYCEKNKEDAWAVNVEGTRNIADACGETGSKLVYISTDYVFDGLRGMYKETDLVRPPNYYALTKFEGEKIVGGLHDHIIARTSVLYGNHPRPNFVVWAIRELREGRRINIVEDQYNSPTLADDLSDILIKLVETEENGIFHTAGSERISRLDFVCRIADIFGLDSKLINPITTNQLKWVAKRPMDSSLDVSKVSCIKRPMDTLEGLKKMRDTM
jgi:dTDP-4-dehydrorhamnose reductase